MRHFFIDLENVRSYGLEGVLLLKPEDMVYVFYSDNANTLTIPTIESLNESPATVKYIKTNYTGANAMDFQIVTLLGATIERDKNGSFYIISHDNGFKSAVKFCEGYFTSYDIVTGVFANIILAINSEKSSNKSGSTAENNDSKATDQKKNRHNRHHRKSDKLADVNSKDAVSKENQAEEVKSEAAEVQNVVEDNVENTEVSETGASAGVKKNRSRRRSRNRHNREDFSVNAEKNISGAENSEDSSIINQSAESQGNEVSAENEQASDQVADKVSENDAADSKNSRNRHNRNRKNQRSSWKNRKNDKTVLAETDTDMSDMADTDKEGSRNKKPETNETEKVVASKDNADTVENSDKDKNKVSHSTKKHGKSGNTAYLYKVLSDYLSKATIDMYATVIDEGVRVSSDKEDLHKFFKKKYESDEAEALFKIIGSDFSELKKQSKTN